MFRAMRKKKNEISADEIKELLAVRGEVWAQYMQSVIVFCRFHLIENHGTAMELLKQFAMKYCHSKDLVDKKIETFGKATQMF